MTQELAGFAQDQTSELLANENGAVGSDITCELAIPAANDDQDPPMDNFMEQFWCIFCNKNFDNEDDLGEYDKMHD